MRKGIGVLAVTLPLIAALWGTTTFNVSHDHCVSGAVRFQERDGALVPCCRDQSAEFSASLRATLEEQPRPLKVTATPVSVIAGSSLTQTPKSAPDVGYAASVNGQRSARIPQLTSTLLI